MATHRLTLTDDETKAVQWAVSRDHEPTIPDVETWLYLKVRGEIRAAQLGYAGARDVAILEAVATSEKTVSVEAVLATVADTLSKPRLEKEALDEPVAAHQ